MSSINKSPEHSMTTLLHINSSARSNGNANQFADRFVAEWIKHHPQQQVVQRNLTAQPVPHLAEETINAFFTPPDQRTEQQRAAIKLSDELVAELFAADIIVIGVPMYNFGIPSTLKAYFDHIARAGITFRYTPNGPEGLVNGKKVYIVAARGGSYSGTPGDTQTAYLRNFLGFLGMTDVTFIYAEGLNLGDEAKARAETAAHAQIHELAAA